MEKFKYLLTNGKFLTIQAETEPSDEQIKQEADHHGVTLKEREEKPAESKPAVQNTSPSINNEQPSLIKSGMDAISQGAKDASIGVFKSPAKAFVGAGEMVHQIPGVSTLVDKLYGTPGLSAQAFPQAQQELNPTNTMQSIGKGIGDIGMMMLAPGEGIPARMASNALIAGTQTGGDPGSMALSGGMAGAAGLASKGIGKLADSLRKGEAAKVAGPQVVQAYKGYQVPAGARNELTGILAQQLKRFGLTGGPKDVEIIANAPEPLRDGLSALSDSLSKPHSFGHIWSALASAAGLAGVASGAGPEGLGIALPLAAMSVAGKYPMQAAKAFDASGRAITGLGQMGAGLAGSFPINVDPMTRALMEQEKQ